MTELYGERVAIYAASFDPITNGHLDLIDRGTRLFDRLLVAVGTNVAKQPLFSVEERIEMIRTSLEGRTNVSIHRMDGLLVDFARSNGARTILRGLRALADFEYEFEMAMMNAHLYPDLETVFLMTSAKWFYVSSSRLREVVRFGGDVSEFVPPTVQKRLEERLAPQR
jgi:pantetheine-phosphate adenylyltransferase